MRLKNTYENDISILDVVYQIKITHICRDKNKILVKEKNCKKLNLLDWFLLYKSYFSNKTEAETFINEMLLRYRKNLPDENK